MNDIASSASASTSTPSSAPLHLAFSRADLLAALSVVVIWGLNFVGMKFSLRDFTPFQLGALRYVFAALPLVFFVKRPALPVRWLLIYGLAQGVGQFGLLFIALQVGMTAALASVVMQTQVFFTTLLGVLMLKEHVSRPLRIGLVLATLGLSCFVFNLMAGDGQRAGTTLLGLVLNLGSAAMWCVSNIITRKAQRAHPAYDAVQFVVWSALVPIIPFVLLSLAFDPPATRWQWLHASPGGWAGAAFLGWIATVLAYSLWTGLFKRHPANRVAPFSLGVPLVGIAAGMLLLGERVTPWQWGGVAFVVCALLVVTFGSRWSRLR